MSDMVQVKGEKRKRERPKMTWFCSSEERRECLQFKKDMALDRPDFAVEQNLCS